MRSSTSNPITTTPTKGGKLRPINIAMYQGGFGGSPQQPPSTPNYSSQSPFNANRMSTNGIHSPGIEAFSTPKNGSSHNTMSMINSSKKPALESAASPKVMRSSTFSMIPSTPPRNINQQPFSPASSAVSPSSHILAGSPTNGLRSPINGGSSIEPRRNSAGFNRKQSAGTSSPAAKNNLTPNKKSILEELKIDRTKNPLHRSITVHVLPSMSSGQFDNLFNRESRKLSYSSASAQGKRPTMEDEHFFIKNIEEALNLPPTPSLRFHSMFGVFDGHCGGECAEHCKKVCCYLKS